MHVNFMNQTTRRLKLIIAEVGFATFVPRIIFIIFNGCSIVLRHEIIIFIFAGTWQYI